LDLLPLEENHYDDLSSVAKDPLIWEQHPTDEGWKEPFFKAFLNDALISEGALIVIDKDNRNIIVTSRFHGYLE